MRILLDVNPRASDDSGAVAVVVALLAVLLLVLSAFAVDIGNAYAQQRQLSVAADADALAAAAAVGQAMPTGAPCTQATLDGLKDDNGVVVGAVAIARAAANATNAANNKSGNAEPVEAVTVTCAKMKPTDPANNAVEVRIDTRRQVQTYFARLVGINETSPNSYAVARYVKVRSAGGLRPWAVCVGTALTAQGNLNTTFWTGIDRINGPCDSTASGNWGAVDFDRGNNSAVDLADWTMLGYPGAVKLPDTLAADPGVSNSSDLRAAFKSLIGQVVLFPVAERYTQGSGKNPSGGANASFDAVGIAPLRVCGIKYGNNTYTTDRFPDDGIGPCWVTPQEAQTSTTSTVKTETFKPRTSAAMAKNSTTLTVADSIFPTAPGTQATATVTIPGGSKDKGQPADLVTSVVTFNSSTSATLADGVAELVPLGKEVTVVLKTTTSTTTITTGGLPLPAPGPYELQGNSLRLIDHIQFRAVDTEEFVTSYPGRDAQTCEFTNPQWCVGATLLWQ